MGGRMAISYSVHHVLINHLYLYLNYRKINVIFEKLFGKFLKSLKNEM